MITMHAPGRGTAAGGLHRSPGGPAALPQRIYERQAAARRVRHPPGGSCMIPDAAVSLEAM